MRAWLPLLACLLVACGSRSPLSLDGAALGASGGSSSGTRDEPSDGQPGDDEPGDDEPGGGNENQSAVLFPETCASSVKKPAQWADVPRCENASNPDVLCRDGLDRIRVPLGMSVSDLAAKDGRFFVLLAEGDAYRLAHATAYPYVLATEKNNFGFLRPAQDGIYAELSSCHESEDCSEWIQYESF